MKLSFILLLFLASTALADPNATPGLAPLQAAYEAKVKKEVDEPRANTLAKLMEDYVKEVDSALAAANQAKKAEDMVALAAEKALISGGASVPPVDAEDAPKSLQKLRNSYRVRFARVYQERDKKWHPIREAYAKSLTPLAAKLLSDGNAAGNLDVKEIIERMKSPSFKLVGEWNIEHSGNVRSVWRFNQDLTYNYGSDTGKYEYRQGVYLLSHTWDWELRMVNDDTFEGHCTRGKLGTIVQGTRIK